MSLILKKIRTLFYFYKKTLYCNTTLLKKAVCTIFIFEHISDKNFCPVHRSCLPNRDYQSNKHPLSKKMQEIRAQYNKDTITVYQAYNKQIASKALQNNQFEPPFSFNRMTWIKPSYLWLMARSNWGTKSNQEYILGIEIKRNYWEQALSKGVLTHPDTRVYESGAEWEKAFNTAPIHIQWDPERTLRSAKLPIRTIQVGISRNLIEEYNTQWIAAIKDYTPLTKKINALRKQGKYKEAKRLLPQEKNYPLPTAIEKKIGVY